MSKREIQLYWRTNSEIIKLLKVARSKVYRAVKIFKEIGTTEDRRRSWRPRTARSKKNIKAVQQKVRRNTKRSARQMAKDMNVSVTSTKWIIKKYLKLLPYKMRKRLYLTAVQKQNRLNRVEIWWLTWQNKKLFFFNKTVHNWSFC